MGLLLTRQGDGEKQFIAEWIEASGRYRVILEYGTVELRIAIHRADDQWRWMDVVHPRRYGLVDPPTTWDEFMASAQRFVDCASTDPDSPHDGYPHAPGYLIECAACRAECHCTPHSPPCVYMGHSEGDHE